MATGAQPLEWNPPSRRRGMRYRVQTAMDVTVLRSGIPDTVPGRSVNLGERGVAAVVAGELLPGEAVGVEIRLPLVADPLRTRALVRHHDKLRSGMEFIGLSAEQQAAIRDWALVAKVEPEPGERAQAAIGARPDLPPAESAGEAPRARKRGALRLVILLATAGLLFLAVFWWWRWNRGWDDIESSLPGNQKLTEQPQANIPADVMEKRVTHRVDPDYPEAARGENLRGVIVVDVVVGRDGMVADVRALNGPDLLAEAAVNALRWWRFEPYRIAGQPVAVETTVAVEFNP